VFSVSSYLLSLRNKFQVLVKEEMCKLTGKTANRSSERCEASQVILAGAELTAGRLGVS
jgi:hypothetical protein